MDAKPHTHAVEISRRRYTHHIRLIYGDQERWWPRWGPLLRLRRDLKVKRIVRRHDRQSVLAGLREEGAQRAQQRAVTVAEKEQTTYWQKMRLESEPIEPDPIDAYLVGRYRIRK